MGTAPAAGSDLKGRVAWVTGAGRGIGRAIAIRLAALGVSVAASVRRPEAAFDLKEELESLGAKCAVGVCDVRSESQVGEFAAMASDSLGPLQILVNNAGIYRTEPVAGHSTDVWREVIETNLTGCLFTSRLVLASMIACGWGRVINISSISGKVGEIWGAAYSASKFGMIGFTQSLALEVARHGVTVNAICPGWVDTAMARGQLTDQSWLELNQIDRSASIDCARLSVPMERFIHPGEVADLVAFLASSAAGGITGQAINICGGLSLH